MDIDLVRAFCTLAEAGSYKDASEKLCITQPALSKKIQRLETMTGILLFRRSRNGTVLTRQGKSLLKTAYAALDSFEQFQKSADSLSSGSAGHLSIGFGVGVYELVPGLISGFSDNHPSIQVSLHDLQSSKQVSGVCSGKLDAGFCRFIPADNIHSHPVCKDQYALVTNKRLNLTGAAENNIPGKGYLRLAQPFSDGFAGKLEKFLYTHNLRVPVHQESDNILTLLSMVAANIGFTILPMSVARVADSRCNFTPFSSAGAQWKLSLIWNAKIQCKATKKFIDYVVDKTSQSVDELRNE